MVPEGWKQSEVGEHVDLLSGFPFKSDQYSDDTDDIRLLRGDNIGQGHLRWREAKRWDRAQYDQLEKYHLKAGDFVIAMDRTWVTGGLKVAEVKQHDLPSLLLQRVSRLRTHSSLDQRLLRFFINGYRFEQYVKSVQTETAVPHISAKQIKDFPIPIPPLPEQRKIADILSTWDQAIEKTEALLRNARTQKRALMQQLLTGKRRFPAFEGQPWKEVRLGDLGKCIRGVTYKPNQIQSSETTETMRLYRSMNIENGEIVEEPFVIVPMSVVTDERVLVEGDLAVCMSNGSKRLVGKSAPIRVTDGSHTVGAFCAIFRTQDAELQDFVRVLFQSPMFDQHITLALAGSSINNLKNSDIEGMRFAVPTRREEMIAIANVMSEKDMEVVSVIEQITKLRTEKKALMQQLLTGKRRVVV